MIQISENNLRSAIKVVLDMNNIHTKKIEDKLIINIKTLSLNNGISIFSNEILKPESKLEVINNHYYWVCRQYGEGFEPAKCKKQPESEKLFFFFLDNSMMEIQFAYEVKSIYYL